MMVAQSWVVTGWATQVAICAPSIVPPASVQVIAPSVGTHEVRGARAWATTLVKNVAAISCSSRWSGLRANELASTVASSAFMSTRVGRA